MPEDHSLLSHLVPKLTPQVEDAATDALAYILNMSEQCRKALVDLVSDGDFRLAELDRCRTQVVRDDRSRLDLVGYDADDRMRLIVESKFWAALLRGQVCEYVKHLCSDERAMLLFVAPEVRSETLWTKIKRQADECGCLQLDEDTRLQRGPTRNVGPMKAAIAHDEEGRNPGGGSAEHRVALMSWGTLLDHLELADASMVHNIGQLKSLAKAEHDKAFAPLHAEDFNPAVPRRHLDFCRIVDDVVDTGEHDGWISLKGMRATAQRDGYLRFFQFRSDAGEPMSRDIALYFSARRWVKSGITPVWLRFWQPPEKAAMARQAEVEYEEDPGGPGWVPLHLLTGVEYSDVFADVVAQVKRVRDIVLPVAVATDNGGE